MSSVSKKRLVVLLTMCLLVAALAFTLQFGVGCLRSSNPRLRAFGRTCLAFRVSLRLCSPSTLVESADAAILASVSPERQRTIKVIGEGISNLSDGGREVFFAGVGERLMTARTPEYAYGLAVAWGRGVSWETVGQAFRSTNRNARYGASVILDMRSEEDSTGQLEKVVISAYRKGKELGDEGILEDALSMAGYYKLSSFIENNSPHIEELAKSPNRVLRIYAGHCLFVVGKGLPTTQKTND